MSSSDVQKGPEDADAVSGLRRRDLLKQQGWLSLVVVCETFVQNVCEAFWIHPNQTHPECDINVFNSAAASFVRVWRQNMDK